MKPYISFMWYILDFYKQDLLKNDMSSFKSQDKLSLYLEGGGMQSWTLMTPSPLLKITRIEEILIEFGSTAESQEERWLADGYERLESKTQLYTSELNLLISKTIS